MSIIHYLIDFSCFFAGLLIGNAMWPVDSWIPIKKEQLQHEDKIAREKLNPCIHCNLIPKIIIDFSGRGIEIAISGDNCHHLHPGLPYSFGIVLPTGEELESALGDQARNSIVYYWNKANPKAECVKLGKTI